VFIYGNAKGVHGNLLKCWRIHAHLSEC